MKKRNNMLYSILRIKFSYGVRYVARYKRGKSVYNEWKWYSIRPGVWLNKTWEDAYKTLERHATPASLAVNFVGTF